MEGRLVFKDCCFFGADGRLHQGMAVRVGGRCIDQIAPDAEVPLLPGDWEVACQGRLISPGQVDSHAHLVGAGLRLEGTGAAVKAHSTLEDGVSVGEIEALTALGLATALRAGVTTVIEHLRAPSDVAGSLAAQARVATRLGARWVNSHRTRGPEGDLAGAAQLEANAQHALDHRQHPRVRSALGLQGLRGCGDELLRRAGRLRGELGLGVHLHLSRREASRLEGLGLLGQGSIAASDGLLEAADLERLASSKTLLAWSPGPALARGASPEAFGALRASAAAVALGSGAGASLADELCAASTVIEGLGPEGQLPRRLGEGASWWVAELFGLAPALEQGALADLVVLDAVPSVEATGSAALMGPLRRARVAWTIVDGRVVVREGQLLAADFAELAREAARARQAVWSRQRAGPRA